MYGLNWQLLQQTRQWCFLRCLFAHVEMVLEHLSTPPLAWDTEAM